MDCARHVLFFYATPTAVRRFIAELVQAVQQAASFVHFVASDQPVVL